MDFFNIFKSKQFEDMLEKTLESELSDDEIFAEIVNCYLELLDLLKIDNIRSFKFSDYCDYHKVIVNGKEYDFDIVFSHNDLEATEILSAIDNFVSELGTDISKRNMKEIEKMLNKEIQNRIK